MIKDPVCGMEVLDSGITVEYQGKTYYFCSEGCKEKFLKSTQESTEKYRYDLIIIGGGPAGLTAGVYASIQHIDTLLLTEDLGGQAIDSTKIKNYMGFENGRLVAVSTLLISGGVAGIYNVGTLPAARHRGFGRAITMTPLLDARDLGYRVGVLQSSNMGFGLYSKLGFREYCKFGRYLWLPESNS